MSASFNKVMLMGNLTRDPQVKQLPSNTAVAEFGLAVSRKFKTAGGEEREEVAFIDCSAFGRQAETISQYCTKGKPIFVEGRLKFDSWDDKQGGGKRSKLTVVVENFQFLPQRGEGSADNESPFGGGGDRSASRGGRTAPPSRVGLPDAKPQARRDPRAESRAARQNPEPPPFSDEPEFDPASIPF